MDPGPNRRMNHRYQTLALIGSSALGQLVVLVTYAIAARRLGPSDFGAIAVAIGWGLTAGALSDLGVSGYCVRQVANGSMSLRQAAQRLAGRSAWVSLAAAIAIVVAQAIDSQLVVAAALLAAVSVLEQSMQAPLRALGMSERAALSSVVDRAVVGAAFWILLSLPGISAAGCLVASLITGSLAGSVAAACLIPPAARTLGRPTRNPWRGAGGFGVFQLALTVQSLDIPLVSAFGGSAAAGLYSAVSRGSLPASTIADAFSGAALPLFARAKHLREAWEAVRRSTWLLYMAAVGTMVMIIFASPLTTLVFGSRYRAGASTLVLMGLGALVVLANQPIATFLMAHGRERSVAKWVVVWVTIQLILVCVGSPKWGALAGGLGYLCFQLGLGLSVLWQLRAFARKSTNAEV